MDPRWFPPLDRPVAPWQPLLGMAYATGLTTLLLPHGPFRAALGLPPLILMLFRVRAKTAGKAAEDYLGAINLFTLLLRWTDYVVLRNPEEELYRVNSEISGEKLESIDAMTLWQRIEWSTSLLFTLRGIGWNWQVKNVVPVSYSDSPRYFVISQLMKFTRLYLLLDLIVYLQTSDMLSIAKNGQFRSLPLVPKLILCWLAGARLVCDTSILYHLFAALAVTLKSSNPQVWPDVYGKWSKAYTIRNLWGSCWHQFLRRIFETYTGLITSALRLQKGSFFSRYTKLYGSFLISAIIHHVGSLNVPWIPGVRDQFLFFMVQPVLISIEDVIIHIGTRLGAKPNWQTKILGFVWVFVGMSISLPYFIAPLYDMARLDSKLIIEPPVLVWRPTEYILG